MSSPRYPPEPEKPKSELLSMPAKVGPTPDLTEPSNLATNQAVRTTEAPNVSVRQVLQVQQTETVKFSGYIGPVPPPEILAQYAGIDPSLVDRLFKLGEKEQSHRHEMTAKAQELSAKALDSGVAATRRGQICGVVISISAFCLAGWVAHYSAAAAAVIAGVDLVALVSLFLQGAPGRNKQGKAKGEQQAQPPGALAPPNG